MKTFIEAYHDTIHELLEEAEREGTITPDNVFQEGIHKNKAIISKIVRELLLPGSAINGYEHLAELYQHAQNGKSCLLFMQHFSNFDLPNLMELLERRGAEGKKIMESIIAIAGMKLNEEHDIVRAFTEAYSRIVICPSTALKGIEDEAQLKDASTKRVAINRAAMWQLLRHKNKGHIILVFPTGTRYRPWVPETGKGLTEVYPYIKSFDYMVFVSINGNTLRINPKGNLMVEDIPAEDILLYSVSPVYNCRDYRHAMQEKSGEGDIKEFTVDQIIQEMNLMYAETEKKRVAMLKKTGREPESQE
ncbi:MAG: 1-acyl-sn-glycerol-3-phosphate acyltransferase [Spirochaetales bacterium]|nr:1-acyl-sn-glycerol-3-phosphate acyltransferase [Spirochaetales bacterium]